jgi:hypothetical protein
MTIDMTPMMAYAGPIPVGRGRHTSTALGDVVVYFRGTEIARDKWSGTRWRRG